MTVVPCVRCRDEDLKLDGVVAPWTYAGTARQLVVGLKFRGGLSALPLLGSGLLDALVEAQVPGDLLVPVPLSARRMRARGYNQAALLARAVQRGLGVDLDEGALCRRRHTPPQAALPRGRRLRSPRGAFLARRTRVRGRCVLLVDDVLTTGATARACALALRRGGALTVVAAVACRAETG